MPSPKEESLAKDLHSWYLEATKTLHPPNFNPNAQKSYEELNEEQREIDRFIARKILNLLASHTEELREKIIKLRKLARFGNNDELNTSYEMAFNDILSLLSDNKE